MAGANVVQDYNQSWRGFSIKSRREIRGVDWKKEERRWILVFSSRLYFEHLCSDLLCSVLPEVTQLSENGDED
ncbi:hypothetical protein CCACVL1_07751 [Corchorus capsularis]|uniref:Uncharacterized protein n=1 Tax=Corchorus capsularis TaxID=210143 RepID=A0A1R3J435_COCAP|nr:hypothetical protein CCACVL1_07751 [Corchorus capsularis]